MALRLPTAQHGGRPRHSKQRRANQEKATMLCSINLGKHHVRKKRRLTSLHSMQHAQVLLNQVYIHRAVVTPRRLNPEIFFFTLSASHFNSLYRHFYRNFVGWKLTYAHMMDTTEPFPKKRTNSHAESCTDHHDTQLWEIGRTTEERHRIRASIRLRTLFKKRKRYGQSSPSGNYFAALLWVLIKDLRDVIPQSQADILEKTQRVMPMPICGAPSVVGVAVAGSFFDKRLRREREDDDRGGNMSACVFPVQMFETF